MKTGILLDISRLLYDGGRRTPTGILRVELAYAQHWLAHNPDGVMFAAKNLFGRLGLIGQGQAKRFIAQTAALWLSEEASATGRYRVWARSLWIRYWLLWRGEWLLHRVLRRGQTSAVYVVVSHAHLESPAPIERLKRRTGARFVYFVHDVIPWQFPEFDTPGWGPRVERRARAAAALADAILVNSEDTRATFIEMVGLATRQLPIVVAPLGVRPLGVQPKAVVKTAGVPYFVMVATIEPKKNHFFLLNIWRQLRAQLQEATPRLILIGKRGWENENVVDMLERSSALAGIVEERSNLSDSAVVEVLLGARALLLPSFAEGYGLPLAEALSLGVPALCSDIPALREVGGAVPEFIDPLDGPSWRRAIVDYAGEQSPRRQAQVARLKGWRAPSWDEHFRSVDALVAELGTKTLLSGALPDLAPAG